MAITLYQVKIASPGLRRDYILDCLNEYGCPGFLVTDTMEQEYEEKLPKKKRLAWYQPNFKCPIGCCFKDNKEWQDYFIDLVEIIKLAKAKNILVHKGHPNPGERDLDMEDRKEIQMKKEVSKKKIMSMSYSPKYAHAKTV